MIEELGRACGATDAGTELAERCRVALGRVEESGRNRRGEVATFCPIWRKPYMTFRRATYIGDMLARAGCSNVFGDREGPDFFEVSIEEILEAAPRLVVLPDEPYVFEARHAEELRDKGVEARFLHVDGKDLTWYGPRIPEALERLRQVVAELA